MHVASHDLFNMKLRTCLDTGKFLSDTLQAGLQNKEQLTSRWCKLFFTRNGFLYLCRNNCEWSILVNYVVSVISALNLISSIV